MSLACELALARELLEEAIFEDRLALFLEAKKKPRARTLPSLPSLPHKIRRRMPTPPLPTRRSLPTLPTHLRNDLLAASAQASDTGALDALSDQAAAAEAQGDMLREQLASAEQKLEDASAAMQAEYVACFVTCVCTSVLISLPLWSN